MSPALIFLNSSSLTEIHDNVIVVLSAGLLIEMPWKDGVKAIIYSYLGGQAVRRLWTGMNKAQRLETKAAKKALKTAKKAEK